MPSGNAFMCHSSPILSTFLHARGHARSLYRGPVLSAYAGGPFVMKTGEAFGRRGLAVGEVVELAPIGRNVVEFPSVRVARDEFILAFADRAISFMLPVNGVRALDGSTLERRQEAAPLQRLARGGIARPRHIDARRHDVDEVRG